jgi:hypothetical protein
MKHASEITRRSYMYLQKPITQGDAHMMNIRLRFYHLAVSYMRLKLSQDERYGAALLAKEMDRFLNDVKVKMSER